MLTYQVEDFTETLEELKPILPLHYEELALDKEYVPLDPDYERYLRMDAAGEVFFMVARDSGKMIGYYIGFIGPGLHYKTCLTCLTDIYYILKEYRGGTGFKFFSEIEKELKKRKVNRWFVGSKDHQSATAFFELQGFNRADTYLSKMLVT